MSNKNSDALRRRWANPAYRARQVKVLRESPAAQRAAVVNDLRSALAAAQEELDRHQTATLATARRIAELERTISGLGRALLIYGHHQDDCALKVGGFCSCGLSDARWLAGAVGSE